jgi:hypothetical protein
MQMQARILVGSLREVKTKKGESLRKTSLKVLDIGPECGSEVATYWIDFLGDAALDQVELDSVMGGEFVVDVRFVRASESKGKAYLNLSGGAIATSEGWIVQSALRDHQLKQVS